MWLKMQSFGVSFKFDPHFLFGEFIGVFKENLTDM